ncbi:8-oxo-dGTP pyrophosphatase MutT (NUDIX family) [Peribacillus deserti]|uniref:8-oxo-dGTP pyrophosphatase MutT (NUDIX family) n=1 Tax=Peribacillus deserti TaxID=673318 RepID=A0ABS2QDM6_9BACI|nr:CoA pyrophosphatase [Peribacillus deserti]MBM7691125.1 8-oxo-dGTP pyrophosphatase MutT (NUDIX family) [Peribacillus deserti]
MELENIFDKLKEHTPTILGSERFSKYAVLLPLMKKEGEIHVLFEVRSLEMRRQPGEICFPGGRIDSNDSDEKGAAIRETVEELGIPKENIDNVYPIDYLISPYGMIVYPFVGWIERPEDIKVNPAEVGETFTVPLTFFLNSPPKIYNVNFKAEPEDDFPIDLLVGGENYQWRPRQLEEYFYLYEDKVIWGLTARILSHFIEVLHKS